MNCNKRNLDDDTYPSAKRLKSTDLLAYINLVPTLQQIAAAKICVLLWRQDNFLKYLANHPQHLTNHNKIWWPQKKKIVKQIDSFVISKRLQDIIANFSDDVGDEIYLWIKSNSWLNYSPKNNTGAGVRAPGIYDYLRNHLVFTTRGAINYEKTALSIFHSKSITSDEKFHLACIHCYEDVLKENYVNRLLEYKNHKLFKKEPLACYWASRFFPDFLQDLRVLLGIWDDQQQSINRRMLKITNNDVTAMYLFNTLDMAEKELVVVELMTHFDINVQTHLFAQVNDNVREHILTQHAEVLERNVVFALWEDCILYYYHTYGSYITGPQCVRLLKQLHRTPEISYFQRYNVYLHELWNCITTESRKYVLLHEKCNFIIRQLLAVFLHFERDDLVEQMLAILENQTIKIPVSKESQSVQKFDSYSNKCRFSLLNPKFIAHNRRLRLVHDLISAKFPNNVNPLEYQSIRNDIYEVFVEYCRCKKTDNIDGILKRFFKKPEDQQAFKSCSFKYMFDKLVSLAVKQSYCFLQPTQRNARSNTPVIYDSDGYDDIEFSVLNSFLKWYFKSQQEIIDFKLETVYKKVPVIEQLLEEKKHAKLKRMLNWFLLDDDEKIHEFKNKCTRAELTALV